MVDAIREEMEEEEREDARFRKAHCCERLIICGSRIFTLKKYCLLAFLLALIFTVQIISIFPLNELAKSEGAELVADLFKKYLGKAEKEKVVDQCLIPGVSYDNETCPADD